MSAISQDFHRAQQYSQETIAITWSYSDLLGKLSLGFHVWTSKDWISVPVTWKIKKKQKHCFLSLTQLRPFNCCTIISKPMTI